MARQKGNLRGVNCLLTMKGREIEYRPQGGRHERGLHMTLSIIDTSIAEPADNAAADLLIATCLAAASGGDTSAYYNLGVAFSTGSHGVNCDLIEAHKWFNLAAVQGHEEASWCRADVSDEMTAREIAEAQRRARQWLSDGLRKAA